MKDLLPTLIEVGSPVIVLVWTLLMTWLARALSERLKSGAARDAALELQIAADTVVRNVAQTLKPKLQEAAGGTLDDAAFRAMREAAIEELREQLSDQAQKVLVANGTRIEMALSRAVESAVHKQKSVPAE